MDQKKIDKDFLLRYRTGLAERIFKSAASRCRKITQKKFKRSHLKLNEIHRLQKLLINFERKVANNHLSGYLENPKKRDKLIISYTKAMLRQNQKINQFN